MDWRGLERKRDKNDFKVFGFGYLEDGVFIVEMEIVVGKVGLVGNM